MVNLTSADISDSAGAQMILDALRKRWPWLKHLFADDGYDRTQLMDKAVFLDFIIEIVRMAFARVSGGAHSGHQSNGDKMTSYRLVYTSSRNSPPSWICNSLSRQAAGTTLRSR